jgi:type II secretory pathway component PulF
MNIFTFLVTSMGLHHKKVVAVLALTIVAAGYFDLPSLLTWALFVLVGLEAMLLSFPARTEAVSAALELVALVKVGFNLPDALEAVSSNHPALRKELRRAAAEMRNGTNFAEACARQRKLFPPEFARISALGEQKGGIADFLAIAARYQRTDLFVKKTFNAAMAYPVAVLFVTFSVLTLLLIVVMPMLADMFSEAGSVLPFLTRLVIAAGAFAGRSFLPVLAPALLIIAHFVKKKRTGRGFAFPLRERLDAYLMMLVAGACLSQGDSPEEALRAAAQATGFREHREAAEEIARKVKNGMQLVDAFRGESRLPEKFANTFVSGILSGEIGAALQRAAVRLDEEEAVRVEQQVERWEAAVILGAGLCVGIAVIGIYVPLFKMGEIAIK